mmetsp:Transcript_15292/g.40773  ORF Transcript_15292/g.40773 Transcript_15292/m.40773 type:complete len:343 (+) Transcript_15292:1461-2489(+)
MRVEHVVRRHVGIAALVAELRDAGGLAEAGAEEHEGPGLVEGDPILHSIAEGVEYNVAVVDPVLYDLAIGLPVRVTGPPATHPRGVQQALRQVPVVQRRVGRDPLLQEGVDQIAVELDAPLLDPVRYPAGRHDARPRDAEAVVLQPHGLHERHIGAPLVVVVARDVACGAGVGHALVRTARRLSAAIVAVRPGHADRVCARVRVPDRGATSVVSVPALDLVGGGPQAPDKALRELALDLVRLGPLAVLERRRVIRAFLVAGALPSVVHAGESCGGLCDVGQRVGLRLPDPAVAPLDGVLRAVPEAHQVFAVVLVYHEGGAHYGHVFRPPPAIVGLAHAGDGA